MNPAWDRECKLAYLLCEGDVLLRFLMSTHLTAEVTAEDCRPGRGLATTLPFPLRVSRELLDKSSS